MPQTVCSLCADKINDFFEYREMCSATNIQTRRLLGLPDENPKSVTGKKRKKVKHCPQIILISSISTNKILLNYQVGFKDMEAESILGDIGNDIDDKTGITDTKPSKKKYRKNAKGQKELIPATMIPSGKNKGLKNAVELKNSVALKNSVTFKNAVGRPRLLRQATGTGIYVGDNLIKEEDQIKEEIDDKTGIIDSGPSTSGSFTSGPSTSGQQKNAKKSKKKGISATVLGPDTPIDPGVPLLTLKEPNKRERIREMEHQKKLATTEKILNKYVLWMNKNLYLRYCNCKMVSF